MKSGPENSGPLAYGMAAGLLAVVFLVLLLVGLLLSVFLVALPVFLLHGTRLLSCPHGGTVCVQKIVLPSRGKLFTKKKKKKILIFLLTDRKGFGILSRQNKEG